MESQSGCYLIFDESNNGTLYQHWSDVIIPEALALFSTQKKIPAFKFKQNGGKTELARDCGGGVKIKNFYTGVAQFVKHAKSFQGKVQIGSGSWPNPTSIYVLMGAGFKVICLEPEIALPLDDAVGVAAVHADNSALDVQSLSTQVFLSAGVAAGDAIRL
eukprot:m.494935 g.494935  ORF g.494935 m.494935 type:complete len:160 (-) comp21797_c0_seq18:2082-2561(-)